MEKIIAPVKTAADRVMTHGSLNCCERREPPNDQDTGMQWTGGNVRKHMRMPADERIAYLAIPSPHEICAEVVTGHVFDISDDGLGLLTECPLAPGSVIRFVSGAVWYTGIVRWSAGTGDDEHRAGIQFILSENASDDRL